MRPTPEVSLIPFDAALLPLVQPWFEHPEAGGSADPSGRRASSG